MKKTLPFVFAELQKKLHLPLLAFLVTFTIDKVLLKFAGIALIYILHPDFSFRKNIRKIPMFYLLLIALGIVQFVLFNKDFSKGHFVAFTLGCIFWLLAFLALHQFRTIIDSTDEPRIHQTLRVFFIINAVISMANLGAAIWHSGVIDPYRLIYVPMYGNSTGDLIKGLFSGPSFLNMMINAFLTFYFLYKKDFRMAFLAMAVTLLTTSNFCNLIFVPVLLACLLFNKDRQIKRGVAACVGMMIFFYAVIAPNNFRYLGDSLFVSKAHQRELLEYLEKTAASDSLRRALLRLENDTSIHLTLDQKYGKVKAFKETGAYLVSSPRAALFGAGMGNFSSFLALRMSHINKEEGSRIFNELPVYIAPEFYNNHYQIYRSTYALPKEFHSIKHFPNSFVNQLLGEYGLAGLCLFLLTYCWFFVRHYRRLSYGKYLLFLAGGFLLFDYLFEYLSVMSIFELLMLLDMRTTK
ncbi:MAG: hypothetical protein J0H74_03140 [Chitinophagaceae bacterium]|nr:hypothetical protein [Chitinophagaceae bacterium]